MAESDRARLSLSIVEVAPGAEAEFDRLAREYEAVIAKKGYGIARVVGDEAAPLRFYAARHWTNASCAERCHADADVRAVMTRIEAIARVSHIVHGARTADQFATIIEERRLRAESDRRSGFDRRAPGGSSPPDVERRGGRDRRVGPRRQRDGHAAPEAPGAADLVGAARQARQHAVATFSNFKVGAALQTTSGAIVTGCNVENATYGLTICAERVAMFKALSEGHRSFSRIAIVADTAAPTPPCGACRQILWEFGGDLEITLANLTEEKGVYRLRDLLPLPFDARLL